MSSFHNRPPDGLTRQADVARAKPSIEVLLDAALSGDLATLFWLVEEAGGPDVFGDDAALVEALCVGKGHAVARDDVRVVAHEIAAQARVAETVDARAVEARGLLSRFAGALGLNVAPREAKAPVMLRPSLETSFVNEAPAAGLGVRMIMRDLFARETWLPRIDQMVPVIAPALSPGVYALQRKALDGGDEPSTLPRPDEVRARLGAGRPLAPEVRHQVAEHLATLGRSIDLDRLSIHDGTEADALCRELDAEAFALGDALVFRTGAFDPGSLEGMHLLVHELTHVWQQAKGLVAPGVDADPALEVEAEHMADRVATHALDMPATPATIDVPVNVAPEIAMSEIDGVQSISATAADDAAIQRCGPREMSARDKPKKVDPPHNDDIIIPPEPEPEEPEDPAGECDACPEPDLEHTTFEPMRQLTDKPPKPGQKAVALSLAGHTIKVSIPEAQAGGEIEVTFPPDASPFTAVILKKAKLRFDDSLRILDGEISAGIDLGKFVHVANTTLRVFEDGRVGAEIRGVEVNVADNVHALVDLVIGPEGVWGMCTVTADKVFVSDLVTVKNGFLHLRVDKSGAISMHGACTVQVHGLGEADLEVCYVDGEWGGSIAIGRREELQIAPGVVLEEIMISGCFAPDEWWVKGHIQVRILDKFRITADAKYHWKEDEGKWSFEGDLDQFEPMPLGGEVELYDTKVHAKYEEGEWEPATFQSRLRHPWVEGGIDEGTWDIEENLWSGHGYVELARQLPMGDSGITLDQAEVHAYVVNNELTELHGKIKSTFPFQGQPTFELSCQDAVYKVKKKAIWATVDLRTIRDIQFGSEQGFHAIIKKEAGATAIVEKSKLTETLGGLAFDARYQTKVLGDGGLFFKWKPGQGVDAGGRFDLKQRFGLPDYDAGPLYLLPQPGHFEFEVINSEPQFIEAQGVGFEIAQGEGGGLIAGQVSGRFDFATHAGDLTGNARVAKSWTEELDQFGSITFLESKSNNIDVAITKNELTKAHGHLDVRIEANATEHVDAFTLEGYVRGDYDPKSGKVSGALGAQLKTDLTIAIGATGDEVKICAGSKFDATMTDSAPDMFTLQLVAQYYRQGELFLEGECELATFDFKTGELDFLGRLTLKQDIEKDLGESGYSIALVKDVTNVEVEVRKNQLVRIGGDIAVQLRDGEGPLLEGSLLNADYRVEEGLFSGDLDLGLMRDLSWPKSGDTGVPGLVVTFVKGSHVGGNIQDNVLREAEVELEGRVHYKGKEQAEAYLNGRWDVSADTFDLDGYFKLTNDLVLGGDTAADETDLTAWSLAFCKDSQVTVGIVANVFQPVGVDVRMELRRGGLAAAEGSVRGDYVFGAEGGFDGELSLDVCREIGLGRAGKFDMVLMPQTHAEGVVHANAFTAGVVDVALLAREGKVDKASLTLRVDYTGGGEFSGNAALTVLDPIRMGARVMGGASYAVDLNTKTQASIGLDKNMLKAFDGAVGIDISRDDKPFAEGNFTLNYDFSDPSASVTAEGALRLIGNLELGKVGPYAFALEGGSEISGRVEDGGLAWLKGKLALAASTDKEGRFATLVIEGKYEGGSQPKFDGRAAATVHKEHDLGFTAFGYGFHLQPSTGFDIVMKEGAFTKMHGAIGVLARQRSKKDKGMRGDVRMTLGGDAVKVGQEWKFDGHADATVEGGIKVGTTGDYVFWIETGSGIAIDVRQNKFVSVEGTLKGKVTEGDKGFLGFDCWVRYAAADNDTDPGTVDARGSCKLLGDKELYRNGGFVFSLMPTAGYTALIVVEKNNVREVGGTLAFKLENQNAKPQPLKVSGSATGHYDNTTGIFSGRGDIRLDSDLEFAMGKNKIVLEKGSGGMTEIVQNKLARLGGTLIGRFDDADGPLVKVRASGEFNAETPELEKLEGSATLMRELKLGPEGAPWIIVDKGLSCEVRMAHNALTYASGKNGKFTVPALRLKGGFDHITMDATGDKTKYSGKGFLEMEMLKEDKEKGRKLNGRLDLEYREDDTWNAKGKVDYAITPYLGGEITAEMDQTLDPVLGGTLVMTKKEMMPARELFEMKFPLIPDMFIPVAGIAGIGFGARAYFGLSSLPMTLSASVGVSNFRPRQMNVPDFEAEAEIDWGLRMKAGALAYLDARLDVLVASAAVGIQGTAELAGDAMVKAKGKLVGKGGKYSGELGVGLAFAPQVTLKAQPYAKASLFSSEWEKTWDAYEYDLGEVFKYEWGSTYKFGDVPEAPKANSERNAAQMGGGGAQQDLSTVNSKAEADGFGDERASAGVAATQGRPGMESGQELKDKKEDKEADGMDELKDKGKEAGDLGSVMAAVGNIISQLGQILTSLAFGPIGLILVVCWKWITGALDKLYEDYCTVRDYIQKNWDKIKPYLPEWFASFVEFMQNPTSAIEKWWNADVYTRQAVAAGDHLKAPAEVRANMVGNLFGGYAAEGDRRSIEEIFAHSAGQGDLRAVIIASEYHVNSFPESWYRHDDWAGSRLQTIYVSQGWIVDPGYVSTDSNVDFDRDETSAAADASEVQAHASQGIRDSGGAMPHGDAIQASFGAHDVSGITAHTGQAAKDANAAMGANAYASGEHVAFGGAPDLHTAAHEAAHVVQQRQGVSLSDGVGASGDAYEQHADAVADKVVAGESAEALLGARGGEAGAGAVQHDKKNDPDKEPPDADKTDEGDDEEIYREALVLSFDEGLAPALAKLEKRIARVAGFGVDLALATQAIAELRGRATYREVEALLAPAPLQGMASDASPVERSDVMLVEGFIVEVAGFDELVDDAIEAFKGETALRAGALEDAATKLEEACAAAPWFGQIFIEEARLLIEGRKGASEAHAALIQALDGEQEAAKLGDALASAEKALSEATATVRARLDAGTCAIDALHAAVLGATDKAAQSQSTALALTERLSFGALFATTRFGHPDHSAHVERVRPYVAEVSLDPTVEAHRDLFLAYGDNPKQIELGMALDGKEAAHWKTYKVDVAAAEYGYTAASTKFAETSWMGQVAGAELGSFEANWKALSEVLATATDAIRLGAQNQGADLASSIAESEKMFSEAMAVASKLHEQGLATHETLSKVLAERARAVLDAKTSITPPVTFSGLYETPRFGDERIASEVQRMNALIDELGKATPYALTEAERVRKLYAAVPELHVHFERAKVADKTEIEAWHRHLRDLFTGNDAILQRARDIGWLINDGEIATRLSELIAALESAHNDACEPITAGVNYLANKGALASDLEQAEESFKSKKQEAEAIAEPNLDKAAVIARLQVFLATEKLGADGAATVEADLKACLEATLSDGILDRIAKALKLDAGTVTDKAAHQASVRAGIYDLIVATPVLYETIVQNSMSAGEAAKNGGSEVAKEALAVEAALNPGTHLAKAIAAKQSGPDKLQVISEFVAKWGKAAVDGVLKEARTHAEVIKAMKSLTVGELAVAQRMLLSGKVTSASADDKTMPIETRLELAAMQGAKDPKTDFAMLATDLVAFADSLKTEKVHFAKRLADAKVAGTKDEDLPKFDEALEKKRAAYVAKVAPSVTLMNFIEKLGALDAHLEVVGFKLAEPAAPGSSDTAGPKHGGGNANRIDVNDDKGGEVNDEAKAKELAELHNQLGPELKLFGFVEHLGMGKMKWSVDLPAIKKLVGEPPQLDKVRYCLDRLEERLKLPYFDSELFKEKLSPEQGAQVRVALGYDDKADSAYAVAHSSYAKPLGALVSALEQVKGKGVAVADLATQLSAAQVSAEAVFSVISKIDDATQLDPRIAPNTRRPATASMVLLNVFSSLTQGVDLPTHLESLFLKVGWITWLTSYFSARTEPGEPKERQRLRNVLTQLGFNVVTAVADGVTGDIASTDAKKLVGDKKFVVDGMKVRPGFDDAIALAIAENIYSALRSDAEVATKLTSKTAAPTTKPIALSVLGGSFPGLLNVLSPGTAMVGHLLFNIKGLLIDERDAIDSAFRVRFGRTLSAEFAVFSKSDMEPSMSEDRDDAEVLSKNVLRGIALIDKDMNALVAAIAKLEPTQRKAVAADKPLMAVLRELEPKRNSELDAVLAGDLSFEQLSKTLAKNDKAVDDIEGVKKDIANYLNILAAEIRAKYPDALKVDGKDHAAHKAAVEADYRSALVKLVAKDWSKLAKSQNWLEWFAGGNVFLDQNELLLIHSIILNGGTEGGAGKLLFEMRTSKWWGGKSIDDVKVILKGLSDTERATIRDDLEVRVAIHGGLSAQDAASCFALLDGKVEVGADKSIKILFVQWKTLDAVGLLKAVGDLDFDTWNKLRSDQSAVLELLGQLTKPEDAKALKAILKFDTNAPGLVMEPDYVAVAEPTGSGAAEVDTKATEGEDTKDPKPRTAAQCQTKTAKGRFLAAQIERQLIDAATEAQKKQNATGFLTQLQASFKVISDFATDPDFRRAQDLTKLPAPEVQALESLVTTLKASHTVIFAAAEQLLGELWTNDGYQGAVASALNGTRDPAPYVVKYHTRGELNVASTDADKAKSEQSSMLPTEGGTTGKVWAAMGTSVDGIAAAITAASDRLFLGDFTNIGTQRMELVNEWGPLFAEKVRLDSEKASAQTANDNQALKAIEDQIATHTVLMNETRARLVKFEVDKHPELARALAETLKTKKEKQTVDSAFNAKVLAVLGATNFTTVKGKTAVASTLAELFGIEHASAEALWDAHTFEAYTADMQAHVDAVAGLSNSWALFTSKTKIAAADQSAALTRYVQGQTDGFSADELALLGQLAAQVAKAKAAINERADKVKGYVVASVEAVVGVFVTSLGLPAGWTLVANVVKSLGKSGLKAGLQDEGGFHAYLSYVLQDAVSAVGGQLIAELSGIVDLIVPGAAGAADWLDFSKWPTISDNKILVAALNAGVAQVKTELTAGIADALALTSLEQIKIAVEKGVANYVKQSGRNLVTKFTDTFATPEGRANIADGLLTAVKNAALEQLKKQFLEWCGIKDDAKDPLVKTLDGDEDGKLDQKKEIEDLAGTSYLERLGSTTLGSLPGFVTEIPVVALIIDTAKSYNDPKGSYEKWGELKKSLTAEALGRAFGLVVTLADLSLESLAKMDVGHAMTGVGNSLMTSAADLQTKFEAFTNDVVSGKYLWDLVVTQAMATVEAINKAWKKYLLADSITKLAGEAGNEGLLDALCSPDKTKQATASGFVQLHEAASATMTTLDEILGRELATTFKDYQDKIDELAMASAKDSHGVTELFMQDDTIKVMFQLSGFEGLILKYAQEASLAALDPQMVELAKSKIAAKLATSDGGLALFQNIERDGASHISESLSSFGEKKRKEMEEAMVEVGDKAIVGEYVERTKTAFLAFAHDTIRQSVIPTFIKRVESTMESIQSEVEKELGSLDLGAEGDT